MDVSDDLTAPWKPFEQTPPVRVEPNLAPGGLVFDVWVGLERVHRDAISWLDEERVDQRAVAAGNRAMALMETSDARVALLVYDGDDGHLMSIALAGADL